MLKNILLTLLLLFGNVMLFAQNEFITTWQTSTSGESITIPTLSGETYSYTVDWGDGSAASTGQTGDASHTYSSY